MSAAEVDGLDLVALLGRLAPLWLRRLEVANGRIVVELELGAGDVIGLSRPVPEGEHDVAALIAAVLADAIVIGEVAIGRERARMVERSEAGR